MNSKIEWPWLIGDVLDRKPSAFIIERLIDDWFWKPYSMIWKICKALEICGLFACMSWAMRGSEVGFITSDDHVRWEPDELTMELYHHGWPAHRSSPKYWPWGWSEDRP